MNKIKLMYAAAIAVTIYAFSASALERAKPEEIDGDEGKTVAWYTAHIQEARAKNKECFGNPDNKALQSTSDCINSLQALKISFSGAN